MFLFSHCKHSQILRQNPIGFYSFAFLFLIALLTISIILPRHQSAFLLISYIVAFVTYLMLCRDKVRLRTLFVIGVVARLLMFLTMPSLSDDIYRFLWDGYLIDAGINPFERLPNNYLYENIPGISRQLYDKLNSPNYFTIYPPLNQLFFWLAVKIGGTHWLLGTNVLRTIIFAYELGSFFLLRRLLDGKQKQHLTHFYWLNPLVILELTCNVHFEAFVIFFVLIGIYFFQSNRVKSALGFGLAVGAKILPLIYFPFLFFNGIKTRSILLPFIAGIVGLITFIPLLSSTFISGISNSLDLYFRSFEFNASVYFIAREVGYTIDGYNHIALIGPMLSLISFLAISIISIIAVKKNWEISQVLLFVLTTYLLFATTVHPWYMLPLIVFGLLSKFYFPVAWSFTIFLTYLGYTREGYELPMYLVAIEYVIVLFIFIYDMKQSR